MWLNRISRVFLRPAIRVSFPVTTHGAENLRRSGPLLVASNHASFIDPWFLGTGVPGPPLGFLINQPWYEANRLWTAFFRANGTVPTVEGNLAGTLKNCVDFLDSGQSLAIFPEGRISSTGTIQRGRLGVGWISALSGVPVTPCGMRGNFESLPRTKRFPKFTRIDVHIGPTLNFPRFDGPVPHPELVHRFVAEVMETICGLAGQPDAIDRARPSWPPRDLRESLRDKVSEKLATARPSD